MHAPSWPEGNAPSPTPLSCVWLCGLLYAAWQVHPSEVRAGIATLDIAMSYDAMVAAFVCIETQTGRRGPSWQWLQWRDVIFVKQATQTPVSGGEVVHLFGACLVLRNEKVVDTHSSRVLVFDASGDDTALDDLLLVPSMQLLNVAVGMGVVDPEQLLATPIGAEVAKAAGSDDW